VRLAVYTDYAYQARGSAIYAERAFAIFLLRLAGSFEQFVLVGRARQGGDAQRYMIPPHIEFVALPYYSTLARPVDAGVAMLKSLRRFWRLLDTVDAVWLLGPHPLSVVFALLASARGRHVALGVRQDLPSYVRSRHPDRRGLRVAGGVLEAIYRGMARVFPTAVVGPALRHNYRHARSLHQLTVSLVDSHDVVDPATAAERSYEGTVIVLSVGRLEAEKNPLLLADVLAKLRGSERDWRLVVCGEGPLETALLERLDERGLREHADLRGYVPFERMRDVYRSSHALLHVTWTEGMPQVLLEALAAGLPIVATDVGGIGAAMGGAAMLVPPGDPSAAATALEEIATDEGLRRRLTAAGLARVSEHTIDREVAKLASFLRAANAESPNRG
jgi:glycosyltransferase involved in cell wall biosynthesis